MLDTIEAPVVSDRLAVRATVGREGGARRRRRLTAAGVFAKAAMASWFVLAAMPVAVAIAALT